MQATITDGEMLINLRAEGDPVKLAATVTKALAGQPGLAVEISQMEHFRLGQPKPPHRVAGVGQRRAQGRVSPVSLAAAAPHLR